MKDKRVGFKSSIKTKQKTLIDEDQKIEVQKLLVGHYIEEIPIENNKRTNYVLQGDGIWEVRKIPLGSFTTQICKVDIPGLKKKLKVGWELNVPKIPATSIDMTLSFFRKIYTQHSSEVFLQYFYDTEKQEYTIYCPKQTVSMASVKYERDFEYEKNKILVFEIHSHGCMGAFFSSIDDSDEKDDRFFGVIGNVKDYYPQLKIRLSVGGRKFEIDIEDIFNFDESAYYKESFPFEWFEQIKEQKLPQFIERSKTRIPSYRNDLYYPGEMFKENFIDWDQEEDLEKNWKDDWYHNEEIQASGLTSNQQVIEKNNKLYVVTTSTYGETWEELETAETETENKGNKDDWRNIKW